MRTIYLILIFATISSLAMSQNRYSAVSSLECIRYIESFGQPIDSLDFFKATPSGSGIIYKLRNKKVVLIPSGFDINYTGFVGVPFFRSVQN
jgi:hypothetical protein